MGLAGWLPSEGKHIKVHRNERVFPALGLTDRAFFRFQSAQLGMTLLEVKGVTRAGLFEGIRYSGVAVLVVFTPGEHSPGNTRIAIGQGHTDYVGVFALE